MRNFRSVIPLAGAMAASMMLSACMDESPWGSTSKETGTIDITLTADYSFDTSRPVFSRAEDDGSSAKDLSDYTTLPELDDFMITLVKKGEDDSTPVFKNTYADFKTFIGESKELGIGQYTITASYGDPAEQGFDKVYLEDSYTFSVLPDRTTEISLKPELKKSMVQVAYTDDFINYMKSYTAKLTSGSSLIEFAGDNMERAAFINPDEASIVVEFKTKYTDKSANVQIGKFAPVAKTLHLITFDISENENGFASITVNLDDSLTDEELTVDITEDLYSTPAPVVTPSGFESGVTYDMATRESSDGKQLSGVAMTVVARGGIKEAVLKVEGDVKETFDLYAVSETNLNTRGIVAKGFYKQDGTSCMASLNLDAFVQNLTSQSGEYTISLNVTDSNSQTSDPVSVTLNSKPVTVTESTNSDGTSINAPVAYGARTAQVSIDFDGNDPTAVVFKTQDGDATYDKNAVVVESLTRAFDTKRCTYTLNLPESSSLRENVRIDAYYNGATDPMANITLPVDVPAYSISDVDAFAHYAYLKIDADPSVLALVTRNIKLKSGNTNLTISDRDEANGILTVTNLSDNTPYSLKTSITGGEPTQQESKSIVTEEAKAIPHGDFEVLDGKIECNPIDVGGQWYVTLSSYYKYQTKSAFSYDLPSGWATINKWTAFLNSSSVNSWFVVPSSWVEHGKGYLRSVGYNHAGGSIEAAARPSTSKSYCKTVPQNLHPAAGELFLGSYNYDGTTETRSEGISFSSRPSSISFDYIYRPIEEADNGFAEVVLKDASGIVMKTESIKLGNTITESDSIQTVTIALNYSKFGYKVGSVGIKFKSSCLENPPLHIPSGDELDEGLGAHSGDQSPKVDTNNYHAVATGSILKIDNVAANYDNAPASSSASKPKYPKKRK